MAVSTTTFDARIARISSGKTAVWVDPETGIRMQRKESAAARMARVQSGPMALIWRLLAVVVAAGLGLVAGVAGPVLRVQVSALSGWVPQGDLLLGADVGAAFVLSFFLVSFLPFRGKLIRLAQFAGVAVMAVFLHNLVWWYPAQAELALGETRAAEIRAAAAPGTLSFLGTTYIW